MGTSSSLGGSPLHSDRANPVQCGAWARRSNHPRERAGMSQKEASDRLSYNVPKVSRIENGQLPDIHALRAMLNLYGVIGDEEAPYIEMWMLAKKTATRTVSRLR
ncbi:helix-turn-helix transcriptional regulator [Lentzea sp.]|uniref:helix-turn-helix domain-containing protein n=1 Tax=Lentzea sp. TaxID=56099 RepID=UPI002ED6A12D